MLWIQRPRVIADEVAVFLVNRHIVDTCKICCIQRYKQIIINILLYTRVIYEFVVNRETCSNKGQILMLPFVRPYVMIIATISNY